MSGIACVYLLGLRKIRYVVFAPTFDQSSAGQDLQAFYSSIYLWLHMAVDLTEYSWTACRYMVRNSCKQKSMVKNSPGIFLQLLYSMPSSLLR